ncbi:unnamed protein product [Musa hybrid cultivar]
MLISRSASIRHSSRKHAACRYTCNKYTGTSTSETVGVLASHSK